ncbi:MAG: hypothetical protein ACRDY7_16055, partial [Acidimicrobiia bacterium]
TTSAPLPLPPGFEGEFIAMTGPEINNAGLSRLTFSPPELQPLTPVRRVSAISACPTAVIVAAAQESVNFSDHIQLLAGDRLVPVPGLGKPFGFGPDLDGACRLLYSDAGGEKGLADRLWRFDPESTAPDLVHTSPGLAGVVWGPGGQVAAVEATRSEPGSPERVTGIRLLQPDGSSRVVPPVTREPGPFEWAPAAGWPSTLTAGPPSSSTPTPGNAGSWPGGNSSPGHLTGSGSWWSSQATGGTSAWWTWPTPPP